MSADLKHIWLQPECCATPDVGRMWCEHDEPVECPDGGLWVEYVRADEITRLRAENERLEARADAARQRQEYAEKERDEAEAESRKLRERVEELEESVAAVLGEYDIGVLESAEEAVEQIRALTDQGEDDG